MNKMKEMGDVVLTMESEECKYGCRICHEAEFESCKSLEAPCSCSGTVKFAHRECIQRWCDQKGNTTCEICLQNYEPGYTAPPKKVKQIGAPTAAAAAAAAAVTIRERLEVPSRRYREIEINGPPTHEIDGHSDCSSAADTTNAIRCKLVALIFTVVLLVRNMAAVLTGETGDYPFRLCTLLILKASGIVIPMYVLVRIIMAIQDALRSQLIQAFTNDMSNSEEEEEEEEQQRHRVAIYP